MVAADLRMTPPRITTPGPLGDVLNAIRDHLLALTIQQTPALRPTTTPRGTFLNLNPTSTEGTAAPHFEPFRIINDVPHIIAPWHLGFVAPEITIDAETGAKTRALPLTAASHVLVAKITLRWIATRRKLDDETPAFETYPVEPWCAYQKCLFENPPEYDEQGNQTNADACTPPDFPLYLVGTPKPPPTLPPRFYWTLESATLPDDLNAAGTTWAGDQIRLETDPSIGWQAPNNTGTARWFFPVELLENWNETENRVSAAQIGTEGQRLIPLEPGEEDQPTAPTQFYLDRQIRVPILHAHRIRPNFYAIGTYGGPLSQIAPAPESTAITGTATTNSADAWINFHAETLVLPLTTTPNCNYLPPVAENDPLLDAPGNHSTNPYWIDGDNITQRTTAEPIQNPPAYLISNLQPSTACAVDINGNLTGARDTSGDSYFLDPYFEQSTTETFYREDAERPLTMRAPRAIAFPLPIRLGTGYHVASIKGPLATNDQRPNPDPC